MKSVIIMKSHANTVLVRCALINSGRWYMLETLNIHKINSILIIYYKQINWKTNTKKKHRRLNKACTFYDRRRLSIKIGDSYLLYQRNRLIAGMYIINIVCVIGQSAKGICIVVQQHNLYKYMEQSLKFRRDIYSLN